ncbi:sensor histidine kinase [Constantimarinum furrinae]|uniref:histidine kinase n=1 Tax=Constantimarinum furrinae TaxID=2562285 RepID=A0A7G8PSQ9_9FLAO|nr:PAS domain-containing sensor histidine kinase [Constantimarinum furrinae]QNJ97375.1 PAS/PAC sensor signal transduction histidine kinase [Constantimarinum furrinae]
MNFLAQKRSKIFLQDKPPKQPETRVFSDFYYKEVAKLTAAGGFSVNFAEKLSFIDPEARRILQTPLNFQPSLKASLQFYAQDHRDKAEELFHNCCRGIAFSTTIKMRTYTGKEFWAKAVGKPVYDEDENVIGIQGVFQDIHSEKTKELNLLKSFKTIESQHSKLNNFAKIVSHSLRSHASNLQLTLELLRSSESELEAHELKTSLYHISENINATVGHISELVSIQSMAKETTEIVSLDNTLRKVKDDISLLLLESGTEIYSDFSEVTEIEYIPNYLESILFNLITNAIKFRHEERNPVIEIYTYKENDETYLMVRDNGSGIDLEKHGNRLFNIYQTFHDVKDSVGVGLFLIKNQIEALQGNITVKSTVNQGTTFTIKF